MKEVVLHVYDVTNSDSEKTNDTVVQINRIYTDRGFGGIIFHSAVQVSTAPPVPRRRIAGRLACLPPFLSRSLIFF